jgi:hypothetical protein
MALSLATAQNSSLMVRSATDTPKPKPLRSLLGWSGKNWRSEENSLSSSQDGEKVGHQNKPDRIQQRAQQIAELTVVQKGFPMCLLQRNTRVPAAFGEERLWIGHLQDLPQSLAFVAGVLVV